MYSRVYVEITNICNLHCSFCHGHSRTPRQLTEAEFAHILQQLQGKTRYVYYHLMGEPLTHPLLPRFLEMAAQQGFQSVITTNGTLLDRRGAALLEAGLHKMFISLHSFEEADFAPCAQYLNKVCDFIDLAADSNTIFSLRLWNNGCDDGRNSKILNFLQKRFPAEWTENTRGFRIRDRLFLEWGDRFAWPDKDAPDNGQSVYCYGLKDHFGILCDGTVVPCCLDSEGTIALGNVFRQALEEILSSPRAAAMAEGFRCRKATEDLCRRCGYATRF